MTIQEKMQAKKTQAIEEIKAEFWNDQPDDDRISEIALANGIDAESVAKWQDEISEGKAAKQQVENIDLAALREDEKQKRNAFQKADAAFKRAQTKRSNAGSQLDEAKRAVSDAKDGFRELTTLLYRIGAPSVSIPSRCQKIHAVDLASERRDAVRQDVRAKRKVADELKQSVESMESQIEQLNERGGRDAVGLTSSGRMLPASEINRSRLKSEKKRLSEAEEAAQKAEKALQPLEQAVADARTEAGL